jgi:hypothetical protein
MRFLYLALLIAAGTGLTALADVFLKKAPAFASVYTLAGALLYCSVAVPVVFAFRLTGFGALFIMWEAVYVLLGIVLASLLFAEPITFCRVLSLILALGALVLAYL